MSTYKHIDKICAAAILFALILSAVFMNGTYFGIQAASTAKGYEARLFDTGTVHTIDIVMDDWNGFLETCTNEEYTLCSVVIDQEAWQNVAIRAKGNTSLTQVAQYGNNRYSFKIEFDHYDSTKSYYGLDKLSLNNLIQDNTCMKDFLSYQMMGYFGADAPLCSYAYITVNGEEWGLYLAVEGVEEAFMERNYGKNYGKLYKPDSQSMGGGRGNGGKFRMDDWQQDDNNSGSDTDGTENSQNPPSDDNGNIPDGNFQPPDNSDGNSNGIPQSPNGNGNPNGIPQSPNGGGNPNGIPQSPNGGDGNSNGNNPEDPSQQTENSGIVTISARQQTQVSNNTNTDNVPQISDGTNTDSSVQKPDNADTDSSVLKPDNADTNSSVQKPDDADTNSSVQKPDDADTDSSAQKTDDSAQRTDSANTDSSAQIPNDANTNTSPQMPGNTDTNTAPQMPGGVRGSSDVSLIYTDDAHDSYQNIFDNAVTNITDSDKDRLIASLKQLNEGNNIENIVNIDEVLRYFVVHNFVCNFDSYTGGMIHNYYLYEKEGQLSMIPWDYNLAFGGFEGAKDASELVNYPIDTPVSGGTIDSRPMLAWIFSNEEYKNLYHQYFSEFIGSYFDSGYFTEMIDNTREIISPYVEKDPTKFCTYEEFETGTTTLKDFCLLRAQSINGQLNGTIPSTSDGQQQQPDTLLDASGIQIADMGNMQNNKGGFGQENRHPDRNSASFHPKTILTPDNNTNNIADSNTDNNAPDSSNNTDNSNPNSSNADNNAPGSSTDNSADNSNHTENDNPNNSSQPEAPPQDDQIPVLNPAAPPNNAPDALQAPRSAPEPASLALAAATAVILLIGLTIAAQYKKRV